MSKYSIFVKEASTEGTIPLKWLELRLRYDNITKLLISFGMAWINLFLLTSKKLRETKFLTVVGIVPVSDIDSIFKCDKDNRAYTIL